MHYAELLIKKCSLPYVKQYNAKIIPPASNYILLSSVYPPMKINTINQYKMYSFSERKQFILCLLCSIYSVQAFYFKSINDIL